MTARTVPAALKLAAAFAATDAARPVLCTVDVRGGRAVATDSYRLIAVDAAGVPDGRYSAAAALKGRLETIGADDPGSGSFPDVDRLIPAADAETGAVTVAVAELTDAVHRAAVVTRAGTVSAPMHLLPDGGRVWAALTTDLVSFREWMPATVTGDGLPAAGIAFNPALLASVVRAAAELGDGATVTLRTRDELKPATVRGDGWMILLMPVRTDGLEIGDIDAEILTADYAPIPPRGGCRPTPKSSATRGACKTCHPDGNGRSSRKCAACVKARAKLLASGEWAGRIIAEPASGAETVAPAPAAEPVACEPDTAPTAEPVPAETPDAETVAAELARAAAELERAARDERARVAAARLAETAELERAALDAQRARAAETVAEPAPAPVKRWTREANRALAAEIRAAGVHPAGAPWQAAKAAALTGADPVAAAVAAAAVAVAR